ncbi:MAG: (2Fe-2S)-binding protein [Treponema sp.]|nr:(2Fe-2S)-binding protein [Treponema sp.]
MSHYKPDPNKNVNLTIDNIPVTVPEGTTILAAARKAGVHIPTLCDHPGLGRRAVCRLCVVECGGRGKLMAACANGVSEGLSVVTNNARVMGIRKMIVELLLANHPQGCLTCVRGTTCELQTLAETFGIRSSPFRREALDSRPPVTDSGTLVRDMGKCVKCGRCVEVCQEVQTVRAINTSHRSIHYEIRAPYGQALAEGPCVYCGQCAEVCPVGAIYEYDQSAGVWAALRNPERHVVARIVPAIQPALGGEFGFEQNISAGKIVTALKRLGFDKVFDAGFSINAAITEENRELLDRVKNKGKLPMITGCSPGWINFARVFYPDLLDHLSTRRSPQQMFGALVKTRYSQAAGIDPSTITTVSIAPCVAKKFEAQRPGMDSSGFRDVDYVLTAKELARMIRLAGIDLNNLPETSQDSLIGDSSGALVNAPDSAGEAVRPGVREARANETPSPEDLGARDQGINETEVDLVGTRVKALVVNGFANARKVLDSIRKGGCDAALVEIMSCPGGCAGGGQPLSGGQRVFPI